MMGVGTQGEDWSYSGWVHGGRTGDVGGGGTGWWQVMLCLVHRVMIGKFGGWIHRMMIVYAGYG